MKIHRMLIIVAGGFDVIREVPRAVSLSNDRYGRVRYSRGSAAR